MCTIVCEWLLISFITTLKDIVIDAAVDPPPKPRRRAGSEADPVFDMDDLDIDEEPLHE